MSLISLCNFYNVYVFMIWKWLGLGGHASHTSFPFGHFVSHLIPNALSQPQYWGDARCLINICMSHCRWLIHLILCSLTQSTASLFQMLSGVRCHETRLSSSGKHSAWCRMQWKSSLKKCLFSILAVLLADCGSLDVSKEKKKNKNPELPVLNWSLWCN